LIGLPLVVAVSMSLALATVSPDFVPPEVVAWAIVVFALSDFCQTIGCELLPRLWMLLCGTETPRGN
jgi:hypothetical protein